MNQKKPSQLLFSLQSILGERLNTTTAVRNHHGSDESPYPTMPPDAVAFVHSTEEVAEVVKLCAAYQVPIIPYGAGTSLEGHILAIQGGICIDLSQMNSVLAIRPEDLNATVQAGVTRKQLNVEIKDTGLFFPIDPGADASLGGMCATRASGTNAVRYGTMRDNVLALTVVLADGSIIKTGSMARKSSAGYDLTHIMVGSEGTLGIITEVTVKLYPQPEAISAATCNFPSVASAVETVIATIQMGIPIARVELLDTHAIRAINAYDKLTLREAPTLFFEFHGSTHGVQEQAEMVQSLAKENGGEDFIWATRQEDRSRLWQARHNAYFAGLQLRPGSVAVTTDTCVPISRLADCIVATEEELNQSPFQYMIVGHVGDGNFHVLLLVDPEHPTEREQAEKINQNIVRRALEMGGTCTGEHGIGLHKKEFLVQEHGLVALAAMRSIKQALDPLGILNPGKIFN